MKKIIFNSISFFSIIILFTGCGLKSFVFGENEEILKEPKIKTIEIETKEEKNEKTSTLKNISTQTLSELEKNTSLNRKVQKVTKGGNMFVFDPLKIKSKCSENKYDIITETVSLSNIQPITKSIEISDSNKDRKTIITLDKLKKGVIYSVVGCINEKGEIDTKVVTKFLDITN